MHFSLFLSPSPLFRVQQLLLIPKFHCLAPKIPKDGARAAGWKSSHALECWNHLIPCSGAGFPPFIPGFNPPGSQTVFSGYTAQKGHFSLPRNIHPWIQIQLPLRSLVRDGSALKVPRKGAVSAGFLWEYRAPEIRPHTEHSRRVVPSRGLPVSQPDGTHISGIQI